MKKITYKLIGALFCFYISLPVHAISIDLTQPKWTVDGFDTASWIGSELFFTSQTADGVNYFLEGYFDWRSNGVYRGTELFTGTLFNDMTLRLDGYKLINPINIQSFVYLGELTADGKSIVNGTWGPTGSGSGTWSASVVPSHSVYEPNTLWLFIAGFIVYVVFKGRNRGLRGSGQACVIAQTPCHEISA